MKPEVREFASVNEMAKHLGLHPQTVYRKIQRGELAVVRIGRTIRIRSNAFAGEEPGRGELKPASALPSFLHPLFWEYDPNTLNAASSIVIERILEQGDLPAWRWLEAHVLETEIRSFLLRKGQKRLSPKSFEFWMGILEIEYEPKDTPSTAAPALGETRWR